MVKSFTYELSNTFLMLSQRTKIYLDFFPYPKLWVIFIRKKLNVNVEKSVKKFLTMTQWFENGTFQKSIVFFWRIRRLYDQDTYKKASCGRNESNVK